MNFIRNILPDKYKYLSDKCNTKKELEENLKNTKIMNMNLFTYFLKKQDNIIEIFYKINNYYNLFTIYL